jgi:prepilin-type N-terminal cleavage/methylation domain-containing protein
MTRCLGRRAFTLIELLVVTLLPLVGLTFLADERLEWGC